MDQQSKTKTINDIRSIASDIEVTKNQIATRKEMIDEMIEGKQEWLDLQSAKEEVKRLAENLAATLANDSDYNNQLEDLGQLKDKLKSQKETQSDLIVGYALETRERQIELNREGDAQELVITGKLGRKGKYQTNIFADSEGIHAGNVTISTGDEK